MKSEIKNIVLKYVDNTLNNKYQRYLSWDICNQYFQAKKSNSSHSIHLAFYLASWGMYRGSSGLLQLNHLVHDGAIDILFNSDHSSLKCNESNEVRIADTERIIKLKSELINHYNGINFTKGNRTPQPISTTDTLISKIMLGTLACVPAYDRYFVEGLKAVGLKYKKFDSYSIIEIFNFVELNQEIIEHLQKLILSKLKYHYPIMKIVDMYFWQIGYDNSPSSF